MKRFLAVLLSFALLWSTTLTGFAATAPAKIPADVLALINKLNFSLEANDKSKDVNTWLSKNMKDTDAFEVLTDLNQGHLQGESFIDDTAKVFTFREVTSPWALSGKVDAKLGQAYASKVSLTAGKLYWDTVSIDTKVWVKKISGKLTVSKVTYTVSEATPSAKANQFMTANDKVVSTNFYTNMASMFDYIEGEAEAELHSDEGVHIVADTSVNFFYEDSLYERGYLEDINDNGWFILSEITVDETTTIDSDFNIYGLDAETEDYEEAIVEKDTNNSVTYKDGWTLKPGVTYQHIFRATGTEDVGSDSMYYIINDYLLK